jgi:hypothetical protein
VDIMIKIQVGYGGDDVKNAGTIDVRHGKLVFDIKNPLLLQTFQAVPKELLNDPERYIELRAVTINDGEVFKIIDG